MYYRWIAALLLCASLGICAGVCQAADGIEFVRLTDAETFGWEPTAHTKLTVSQESKVGRYAVRSQPVPDAKPYGGMNLHHNVDLTGAGAGDTIVFHVKQNFDKGMTIQLWMDGGAINRGFQLKQGLWTRVELDLDMAHWGNPKKVPWGKVRLMQLYSKPFSKLDHYMILDGLDFSVGGRSMLEPDPVQTMQTWEFPHQNDAAWYLGNAQAAWAISKTTGQVLGGWNAKTKERYLDSLGGRYHLEDRKSLVTGRESTDKELQAKFDETRQRVELTCSNTTVPDLIIKKQYWPDGNKLFQRIAFTTRSKELQFVTYN